MTTEQKLTINQRIRLITATGWSLAYDGCHKIYFLQDEECKEEAIEFGYEIFFDALSLSELYENSCSLVFVSNWGRNEEDFKHKWNIEQFAEES